MTLFSQEKQSKRCKFLASFMKYMFSKCYIFVGKLPVSSPEAEEPALEFDDEDDVCVSAIISKYVESKSSRRALPLESSYLMIIPKAMQTQGSCWDNIDDVSSTGCRLSRCSSATSCDAYFSVKTHFSRSSSLNRIDFQDFSTKSVVIEFFQCEGWPFGLCRRALLLPPLPKSPPDSWSWRKSSGMATTHG